MDQGLNYLQSLAYDIYLEAGGAGDYIPPSQEALYLAYAMLAQAKGLSVTNEDVHDGWSLWQIMEGNHHHPSLIPYDDLRPEVQELDALYQDAIREVVRRRMVDAVQRAYGEATIEDFALTIPPTMRHSIYEGEAIE